jgi:hypothetical protein
MLMANEPTDADLAMWLYAWEDVPDSILTAQDRNWVRTIHALQAARKRIAELKLELSVFHSKQAIAEAQCAKLEAEALTRRTKLDSGYATIDVGAEDAG